MACLTETQLQSVIGTSTTVEVAEQSRKLVLVSIGLPILVDALRNGADGRFIKIDGLPSDAMIVGFSEHVAFMRNEVVIRVWSESFKAVEVGHPIPQLELWCSVHKCGE